jgi:hypothetical protein
LGSFCPALPNRGDLCENQNAVAQSAADRPRSRRDVANEGPIRVKAEATTLYPFVPSGRSFETSLEFFAAIGFETKWRQDGLAGLRFGGAYFMLQQIDVPQWQENQMITFEVTDLGDYWATLDSLNLPERFPGVKLRPPTDFPWGREIHLIDPGGVCWHVRQAVHAS